MDLKTLAELPRAAFQRGLKRIKEDRYTEGCVVLGFDCEYHPETEQIVCYQLSDGDEAHAELLPATEDLDWPALAHWVRTCLQKWRYPLTHARNILLVSHFSTAELSHIKDFWLDATVRRVSPQQVYNAAYKINEIQTIHIFDSYHFFNASLSKVAKTFGETKLDWDFEERPTTHDLLDDPEFRKYALNDAIICARIFNKFRDRLWNDHQIDAVQYPTPASVAMAVYRKKWLRADLGAPDTKVRRVAWRCLWGGRAEAYKAGDLYGEFTLRDVKSLYPRSCELLERLPRPEDWYQTERPINWRGFCNVQFEFPPEVTHPCLPVWSGERLIFPSSGISDCTLAEAKVAQKMGAKLHWRTVWEYDNGDPTLPNYMTHWTQMKDIADKEGDKVGRELSKLFMNALIGKLSQHKGDVDIEDAKAAAELIGVSLETILDPGFFHPYKPMSQPRVGGNIMPEWSALILGKARAIMAELLAQTDSAICSTDSILIPSSQDSLVDRIMNELGVLLTSKNENKHPEKKVVCEQCPKPFMPVTRVRIIRSRCYVGLCPHGNVVWSATHAVHMPRKGDFAANFILGERTKYKKTQHVGLKTAIRTRQRFFKATRVPMTFSRGWDQKRKLLTNGLTTPWQGPSEYLRKVK